MAKYVLTGGATGIGAAIKAALLADQNEVITLDIRDGDYDVDLGDAEARAQVIARVKADHPNARWRYHLRRCRLAFPRHGENS